MTKRADGRFQRNREDFYPTPPTAVQPLLPYVEHMKFAEPCSGDGSLVRFLESRGLTCTYAGDIQRGENALKLGPDQIGSASCIITNPPYARQIMHPLIEHFMTLVPVTWLLVELDWFATLQSAPYVRKCTDVVPIGRVKWIPKSPHTGFDNYAWARFHPDAWEGPRLHIRKSYSALTREPDEADERLAEWGKEIQQDFIREAMFKK